ncbi:hypothetical protein [Streptosporangium sp. NPDC051022]|uniref:hypothetical protein n=1 Tax=Streptosporangium sp. NPDC051022 TaxID=3155752 RepID=UPI003422E699
MCELSVGQARMPYIMVISPPLPFAATTSPNGDIVVFYLGPEPRMTSEQALVFAAQLRDMAAEASLTPQPSPDMAGRART